MLHRKAVKCRILSTAHLFTSLSACHMSSMSEPLVVWLAQTCYSRLPGHVTALLYICELSCWKQEILLSQNSCPSWGTTSNSLHSTGQLPQSMWLVSGRSLHLSAKWRAAYTGLCSGHSLWQQAKNQPGACAWGLARAAHVLYRSRICHYPCSSFMSKLCCQHTRFAKHQILLHSKGCRRQHGTHVGHASVMQESSCDTDRSSNMHAQIL